MRGRFASRWVTSQSQVFLLKSSLWYLFSCYFSYIKSICKEVICFNIIQPINETLQSLNMLDQVSPSCKSNNYIYIYFYIRGKKIRTNSGFIQTIPQVPPFCKHIRLLCVSVVCDNISSELIKGNKINQSQT